MAEDMGLLDDLFDDIELPQKKEKEAVKFKPKNLKNLPKPSILKLQKPSVRTDTLRQSQHADSPLGAHLDYSLNPYSTTDKFEGTSNPKTKLQPQRRKQPAAPGSDGPTDINRTEMPDHESEGAFGSGVDLSKSDFEAPNSLSEFDFLDNVSPEPLFSSAEPTVKLQPKENEKKGKKVTFVVPEAYSTESPDRLINQGFVTSEEIQANDASESGVEKHTQNNEQGPNYENRGGKENEDAPNLDDIFDFLDDTDPSIETDEANEDPTDRGYTGEKEDKSRSEKETPIDVEKRSKRKTRGSTDADANVEEGSPKKKGKLSHRIRRKRRKVDPVLLETPENEINPMQISIRNLILLAEAKEKKWNKEADLRNPNGDASSMPRRRREQEEFEFFDFEGNEEEHNQQDSAPQEAFEPTVKKLNYHTYMNRSSSSRWTQSETELFYKGIRQFGTDFAMIQQLFPNRTRHQIKLKFKSEDKKHPTRVRDAITDRLTDNSQFEKVIEILEIQADKVAPEESEASYQADHWKNDEEINEAEENYETAHNDLDNSGKHDSVPNVDLDEVFNWDNEELEQEEFAF